MNNARPVKPSSVRTFLVMLICTAFLVVAWEAATAQPLTFQWARQSTGHAEANSMAADSSGNAYVAGGFAEATVSFGGITLTNLGNGDAFVAKYDVSGHVLWVRQGGVIAGGQASILDIALDVAGNAYAVGYFRGDLNFGGSNINSGDINGDYDGFVAKFSAGGSLLWMRQIGGANSDLSSEVAVDGVGNAYVAGQFNGVCSFDTTNLTSLGNSDAFLAKYNAEGTLVWVRQAGGSSYEGPSALAADAAGNCYMAGDFQQTISFGTTSLASSGTRNNFFVKYNADGEVQWAQKAGGAGFMELPAATADAFGNLYVTGYFSSNVTFGASNVMSRGGVDAFVAKFNSNGVMQWFQSAGESNRYAFSRDVAVNSAGAVFMTGNFASMSRSFEASIFFGTNRLISAGYSDAFFAKYSNDGALQSVGRIGGQGDNDNGYCIAAYGNNNIYAAGFFTGTATIGNTILDGVGSMFLTKLVPVGTPRIIVDGNTVFGGSVFARGSASIVLETGFAGGTILYSLNGSDPALSGFLYSGPFVARRNATLRAVAYNADFTQAVPSDPVEIVIVPTLSAATAGGGSVAMDPPAGAWWSNGTAVVTATPAPGWTFLHWLGDATGTNPAATVSMSRNRCVQAIFGAGLGHTVVGSGSVARSPAAALYPHGTAVRLTAVPAAGNYFALWGNAASGTNHPLNFVVTNANATVTAVFAALPANQHALTVLPDGFGSVSASPRANRYGTGANVTLTATPDAGQSFVSWSGDASGTQNPLTVVMNSSKVITANFTKRPRLAVFTCGGALDPASVPLLLSGEFGGVFVIEASADLQQWSDVATVTNLFGTVQFNDTTGGAQRFYRARPGP